MIDKNDYFETSEDDFAEQKEEEISLEDEGIGTIKNSKIKIEEFFDKNDEFCSKVLKFFDGEVIEER